MPNDTLDIAFATSDAMQLDAHFGSSPQFSVYRLSITGSEYIESIKLPCTQGHNAQKIAARLNALTGCFAVYCLACGNPVRQQLLTQGIRVVVHPRNEAIDKLITQIQANWPGETALRQKKQRNKKRENDYFTVLAESEWED